AEARGIGDRATWPEDPRLGLDFLHRVENMEREKKIEGTALHFVSDNGYIIYFLLNLQKRGKLKEINIWNENEPSKGATDKKQ
ncbi:hypothetical protein ACJX0J_040979, partial [Zea mays]